MPGKNKNWLSRLFFHQITLAVLGFLILLFVNLMLAVSLYPIIRMGQLSIGHAAFMAIGAYTSTLLVMKIGLSFWLSLLAGGVMAAIVALLVGSLTLRIKGLFFVVITFGINEIVRLFIVFGPDILGGSAGIPNVPHPDLIAIPGLLVIDFASRVPWYYLSLILALITIFVIYNIDRSRIGRTYRAIDQNDMLAESIGINLMGYKVTIFTIGCFFAGIAGSLFAHYYSVVTPDEFTIWKSIYLVIYIQVGGLASIAGPIAGTVLLNAVDEIFRFSGTCQPLIYGAILVLVILFLPEGILGLPSALGRISRR